MSMTSLPLDDKLRRIGAGAGLVAAGLGFTVLAAWAGLLGGAGLRWVAVGGMHAGSAAGLGLLGLSIWFHGVNARSAVASVSVFGGLALGALVLFDDVFAPTQSLHRWFAVERGAGAPYDATHAGLLLLVAGVAILATRQNRARHAWAVSAWLANTVIAIAAACLLGLAVERPDATTPLVQIGADLAAGSLALGVGTVLLRPEDKHVRLLFARNAAGILARRLFLGVAMLPLLFGGAFTWMTHHGHLDPADGVLLFIGVTIFCGFLVGLFSLETAAGMSEGREEAEQARLLLTARLQEQALQLQETVSQRTRELRDANASLRATAESNALLALVAQNTTSGVVITNGEGEVEWVNAAFSRITGYDLSEVKGRKPGHLLQGRDTDPVTIDRLRLAVRHGQACHVDVLNYTKQGRPFWHTVDIQPVRERTGRVVNFVANLTDITSQHESTKQLQVLNERLQLALRSSRYGVWEHDIVLGRHDWDDRVLEIYGLARASFDPGADPWRLTCHPEDYPTLERQTRQVLDGGDSDFAVQFRIVRPDGGIRHIETHGHAQRGADGRAVRLVGLTRDITESKHLEQALELAEQRWQLAIEGTNDSVWDWDIQTGHVYHDERWGRLLGYNPGELDHTIDAWRELAHPEDLPHNEAALHEHFAQRTPFYRHELRMRAKDGTWRWILDRGKVVQRAADGRALRMVGTHSNVTERRELEERLRKTEQLASEVSRIALIGGWEIDLITSRVTWSEGARRIYEVDDDYQPTLDGIWDYFPGDALQTVQSALRQSTPARPSFDVEVPLVTAKGRSIWVRILGHGEFVNGRGRSVRGAIQDVTARHDSEEARRELEAQLFQAQKMETLGTLAGGIAHDFNNLLTGIIGYHELAADSIPSDHAAREWLAEARNASLRARELVEQILTFGRQSSSAEHVPVDLANIVEEARRFLRATLPANIGIEVTCAPQSCVIQGDATQIHQVILNLGSNAAHAMRQNGGTVKITVEPAEPSADLALTVGAPASQGYLRLSVCDTGHGMDESTRRRIFDPFFTTKKTREGTGLGLAVVHGIVRSHRGVIDVESTPGKGSNFHVYFPVVATDSHENTFEPGSAPRGEGEFVCVVDDEEVVGSCTKLVLETQGYRSLIFSSAEQCLEHLQENPEICSVLVTDQTMPGMQGTELAVTMRRLRPGLPVVIMSGYFSKISPQALDQLGTVELLAKPFTTDELAHAVYRALHPQTPVEASARG